MKPTITARNAILAAVIPLATAANSAVAQAPQAPAGAPPTRQQANAADLNQLNREEAGTSALLIDGAQPQIESYLEASKAYAKAIREGKREAYLYSVPTEPMSSTGADDQSLGVDVLEAALNHRKALESANAAGAHAQGGDGQISGQEAVQQQEEMPTPFDCRHPHLAHLDAIAGKRESGASRLEAPVDAVEGLVKGGYGLGIVAELAVLGVALTQIPRGRFWATALTGTFSVTAGAAVIGAAAHGSADVVTPPIKRWVEVDDRLSRCNVQPLGQFQAYTVQIPKPPPNDQPVTPPAAGVLPRDLQ